LSRESTYRTYATRVRKQRKKKRKKKIGYNKRRRRWVLEWTNSWHNRFRKLLVRYEKKSENYLGLVQLACCIIIYRRLILG
jgi:putative transposase